MVKRHGEPTSPKTSKKRPRTRATESVTDRTDKPQPECQGLLSLGAPQQPSVSTDGSHRPTASISLNKDARIFGPMQEHLMKMVNNDWPGFKKITSESDWPGDTEKEGLGQCCLWRWNQDGNSDAYKDRRIEQTDIIPPILDNTPEPNIDLALQNADISQSALSDVSLPSQVSFGSPSLLLDDIPQNEEVRNARSWILGFNSHYKTWKTNPKGNIQLKGCLTLSSWLLAQKQIPQENMLMVCFQGTEDFNQFYDITRSYLKALTSSEVQRSIHAHFPTMQRRIIVNAKELTHLVKVLTPTLGAVLDP